MRICVFGTSTTTNTAGQQNAGLYMLRLRQNNKPNARLSIQSFQANNNVSSPGIGSRFSYRGTIVESKRNSARKREKIVLWSNVNIAFGATK